MSWYRVAFSKRYYCFFALMIINLLFQVLLLYCLKWFTQTTHSDALEILKIYKNFANELNRNSKSDSSGSYKVIQLKNSDKEEISFDVTLVTQCSSNHLEAVKNLSDTWKGPLSVAVYSEIGNLERSLWDLAKLQHCCNSKNMRLHLVVPAQDKYNVNVNGIEESEKNVSCNLSLAFKSKGSRNYNWSSPYPVNFLRNVAKRNSLTEYILVVDVDMIPSANLRFDFLNFIRPRRENVRKEVYIAPIFEVEADIPIPQNKAELINRIKLKQARPFYAIPCKYCQKMTKYGEWLSFEERPGTRVLYQIQWRHPWEPFFIARRDVPDFDQRFRQYGMNRVSQICELHVAGYQFLVLDNVFLVHKGFKAMTDFHETKNKEMEENRKLYANFKDELKSKYPDSERSC